MRAPPPKSLWYNLGAFFGHVKRGVTTDPAKHPAPAAPSGPPSADPPPSPVAARTTQHEIRRVPHPTQPGVSLTVRRTVIDEVHVEPPAPPGPNPPPPAA